MEKKSAAEGSYRRYMREKMYMFISIYGTLPTENNNQLDSTAFNNDSLQASFKDLLNHCESLQFRWTNANNKKDIVKKIKSTAKTIKDEVNDTAKYDMMQKQLEPLLKELYKPSEANKSSNQAISHAMNDFKAKSATQNNTLSNEGEAKDNAGAGAFAEFSNMGAAAKRANRIGGSMSKRRKSKKRRGTKKRR
jgi:hypothetical protein